MVGAIQEALRQMREEVDRVEGRGRGREAERDRESERQGQLLRELAGSFGILREELNATREEARQTQEEMKALQRENEALRAEVAKIPPPAPALAPISLETIPPHWETLIRDIALSTHPHRPSHSTASRSPSAASPSPAPAPAPSSIPPCNPSLSLDSLAAGAFVPASKSSKPTPDELASAELEMQQGEGTHPEGLDRKGAVLKEEGEMSDREEDEEEEGFAEEQEGPPRVIFLIGDTEVTAEESLSFHYRKLDAYIEFNERRHLEAVQAREAFQNTPASPPHSAS